MVRVSLVLALCVVLQGGSDLPAQSPAAPETASGPPLVAPDRLGLGRLVRDLDRAWLAHPEPEARARAVGKVATASAKFFQGDTSAVARDLVDAAILAKYENGEDVGALWAGSVVAMPGARILAPGADLQVTFGRAFPIETIPETATAVVTVAGKIHSYAAPLPPLVTIALPEGTTGDLMVGISLVVGDRALRSFTEPVAVIDDAAKRAEALRTKVVRSGADRSLELETARGLWSRFMIQLDGNFSPEWPIGPAAALARAERLADLAIAGERDTTLLQPGNHWVALPLGRSGVPCKIRMPAATKPGPRPLVVAVHGLAGSEHLWFSAYGLGMVAELGDTRGWIVAAPRLGTMVNRATVGDVVTALESFLPVDPERIFLIGHSMGAVQVNAATAREPKRFRAIAALSGGGALVRKVDLTGLPCFVAAGDQDFGRGMAMAARDELERAGANVTSKIYDSTDHMMMVPDSLPDVFEFFEKTLSGSGEAPDRDEESR